MCGISGCWMLNGESADRQQIKRMSDRLAHRGPDANGIYMSGPVGLGHRRLSIIDLSVQGKQPMSNEDGSIWITFNGEIYNFQSLREQLLKLGHVFQSTTDTEVIVHAYEEYGTEVVKKIHGMFAFTIYDQKQKIFFMARDRVGKKPFFYLLDRFRFSFASEIKSLLTLPDVPREVNSKALSLYLSFQYIPAPETIFKGIYSLPPGHFATFHNGHLKIIKYWQYARKDDSIVYPLGNKMEEPSERIEKLLVQAVKDRLVSDAPLGAFLSGGVDSSLVAAIAARYSNEKINTYSIGFSQREYDETPFARKVAESINTNHHELFITKNLLSVIPQLVTCYDQPFGDVSALPTYFLSKLTAQHVKVVLSGDGGDEIFGGYQRYLDLLKLGSSFWRKGIPRYVSSIALNNYGFEDVNGLERFRKAFAARATTPEDLNAAWTWVFYGKNKDKLLSVAALNLQNSGFTKNYYERELTKTSSNNFLDNIMEYDVNNYLPHCLLVKVDIASMANSLEVRSPLLDFRVVDAASKMSHRKKLEHGRTKTILKDIALKYLPSEIVHRRKQGFSPPLQHWLRNELVEIVNQVLVKSTWKGLEHFDSDFLINLIHDHQKGKNRAMQIWLVFMFVLWHRYYIEKDDIEGLFSEFI